VVFDDPRLFGLQFYLNGRLERATPGRKEPWADLSVEEVLKGLDASGLPPRCVFVSDTKRVQELRAVFKRMDIPFQEVYGRFWSLFVTRPSTPDARAQP
jgi:hypothetical protein